MKDKWVEFAGDFKAPEELEEELEQDGLKEREVESAHFGDN